MPPKKYKKIKPKPLLTRSSKSKPSSCVDRVPSTQPSTNTYVINHNAASVPGNDSGTSPIVNVNVQPTLSPYVIGETPLNEIYTVAFSIERTNECYDGWNSFLSLLKNACSLLEMKHPLEAHSRHAYFTFVSDRDKGLVQALSDIYPNNHTTQCIIHIQRNVTTKYRGRDIQSEVYKIAKTFSLYQEKNARED
jgi:Transposase, Mutator family